jgi:carboxylate-amine ligase
MSAHREAPTAPGHSVTPPPSALPLRLPEFREERPLALGVECEWQIVSRHDYEPTPQAGELLRELMRERAIEGFGARATPRSLGVATGLCADHAGVSAELSALRDAVVGAARRLDVGLCGGGVHPSHVAPAPPRVRTGAPSTLAHLWTDEAARIGVYGLHVHIGCAGPDQALRLMRGLARFVPHLIALSASSPFLEGIDSGFDSARQRALAAFPTAGCPPLLDDWESLESTAGRMAHGAVLGTLDDLHWDLCPRPDQGTLVVRVMDAPLTIDKAAALAAYVQCLARWLRIERPFADAAPGSLAEGVNRWQAARYGLEAIYVDPASGEQRRLRDEIRASFDALELHAMELRADAALRQLRVDLAETGNDAGWLRQTQSRERLLAEVVRQMCVRFEGDVP